MTILTACPAVTGPPAPATSPSGRRATAAASAALLAGAGPEWKPCPVPAEPPGQSSFTITRLDRRPCGQTSERSRHGSRGSRRCWRPGSRMEIFPATALHRVSRQRWFPGKYGACARDRPVPAGGPGPHAGLMVLRTAALDLWAAAVLLSLASIVLASVSWAAVCLLTV